MYCTNFELFEPIGSMELDDYSRIKRLTPFSFWAKSAKVPIICILAFNTLFFYFAKWDIAPMGFTTVCFTMNE